MFVPGTFYPTVGHMCEYCYIRFYRFIERSISKDEYAIFEIMYDGLSNSTYTRIPTPEITKVNI